MIKIKDQTTKITELPINIMRDTNSLSTNKHATISTKIRKEKSSKTEKNAPHLFLIRN